MRKYHFKGSSVKRFFTKNGFYIAIALSLCGLGTAAYLAISSSLDILTPQPQSPQGTSSQSSPVDVNVSGIPVDTSSVISSEKPPVSSDTPSKNTSSSSNTSSKAQSTYPTYFVMPVNGTVYQQHSDDELVFNNTMKDWRVHNGIDIEAAVGTNVVAVADGKVTDVSYDDQWGYTVTVEMGGGLTAKYCNLQKGVIVKEGETVKTSQVIGGVGDTAYLECLDKSHLHFEMCKDGKQVDPLDAMGKKGS